jgi:putative FmdB family regulatory protein
MPTYDYECNECGHAFEKFQPITSKPIKKCPKCGKMKVKRLIGTGAGVIFKGSGFYQTDYRSGGYKESAKKESDAVKPAADGAKTTPAEPAATDKPAPKTDKKTSKK